MKRDMDFIREILLQLEELDKPRLAKLAEAMNGGQLEAADYTKLVNHIQMLIDEVGLVAGMPAHTLGGKDWLDIRLTWRGHDYLDTIRDPEIWSQTKDGAKAAGGFTIEILGALAKGLIKQKIKQHTGVEIEL